MTEEWKWEDKEKPMMKKEFNLEEFNRYTTKSQLLNNGG